jgi:hypothetical protein
MRSGGWLRYLYSIAKSRCISTPQQVLNKMHNVVDHDVTIRWTFIYVLQ